MAKSNAERQREYRARKKAVAVEHKIKDYGINKAVPKSTSDETVDVAHVIPVSVNSLAGGVADFPEDVYDLDPVGHLTIRTCPTVQKSMTHGATLATHVDWVVVGESDRASEIQEIIDQASNWEDMVEWLFWAILEGVRFYQIKPIKTDKWVVPDFYMGGRKKQKAGGTVQWDGTRLTQVQQYGFPENREAEVINVPMIIHRPGGGSNPEGDLDLAIAVYYLAKSWREASKNIDSYFALHGLPMRILQKKLDKATFDQVAAAVNSANLKLAQKDDLTSFAGSATRATNQKTQIVISDEDTISLLEPRGKGFEDMSSYQRYIDGIIDQLIVLNQMTKSTVDAGPVGSSRVASEQQDASTWRVTVQIAETLNRYLLPWIIKSNPDLSDLPEGDPEPYIWPMPYGFRQADNNVDDESLLVQDVNTNNQDAPAVVAADPDPNSPEEFSILPGRTNLAHPNCRCEIVGDEWVTAEDARVCPICLAAEIQFNAGGGLTIEQVALITGVLTKRLKDKESSGA